MNKDKTPNVYYPEKFIYCQIPHNKQEK